MKSPLQNMRIGIVGVGKMGLLHLKKCQELPQVDLAGVFDTDAVTAKRVSEESGVPVFENLAELFFESDGVIIASPTPTHYRIAKQALESGVHVLLEKPVTETVAEAEGLVALARQNRLVFQVGFVERFRFSTLTQNLDLNTIRFIESHRLSPTLGRDQSVDVVSDIMIHDLDLALSLIPEESIHVSAVGVPVLTPLFDLANVRLEFPSGAVVNLNASRVSARPERKFRVFSSTLYASVDFMANRASVNSRTGDGSIQQHLIELPSIDALLEQNKDFVESIRHNRLPRVSGKDGLRALQYTYLIKNKIEERAAWKPRPIPLEGPESGRLS